MAGCIMGCVAYSYQVYQAFASSLMKGVMGGSVGDVEAKK